MKEILIHLFENGRLSRGEAGRVLTNIAGGKYNEAQISAFMTVFLMRSIDLEELIGFREALLNLAEKVDLSGYEAVDIVGTGGDGKNTFNISTLSCFVIAGAGCRVAKHGNYGATSVSGASNVLEQFGAKFTSSADTLRKSIEESGVAFLHAPLFNPAMKNVAPVRRALGVRTFFNILGPLINPAQPPYQVLGVYSLEMMRLYDYFNQQTNSVYTLLHSLDGYDEISLTSDARIITRGSGEILTPVQMGFKNYRQEELSGGKSVGDAAAIFENVLTNRATEAQRDVVLINSSYAIKTVCPQLSLEECRARAEDSLLSGNAKKSFDKFLIINQ
jgi:anthranilate phosphoribosyltransferase